MCCSRTILSITCKNLQEKKVYWEYKTKTLSVGSTRLILLTVLFRKKNQIPRGKNESEQTNKNKDSQNLIVCCQISVAESWVFWMLQKMKEVLIYCIIMNVLPYFTKLMLPKHVSLPTLEFTSTMPLVTVNPEMRVSGRLWDGQYSESSILKMSLL